MWHFFYGVQIPLSLFGFDSWGFWAWTLDWDLPLCLSIIWKYSQHRLYERINYGTFLIWIKSQWKHNDKYIWAQKAISCSLEPSYIIQALTRRDRQTGHRFTTPRAVIHVTRLYLKYKHKRIISLSPGSECLSDAQCLCQNPLMPHLTPLCRIFSNVIQLRTIGDWNKYRLESAIIYCSESLTTIIWCLFRWLTI